MGHRSAAWVVGGLLVLGAGLRALRFWAPFATPWHWDETALSVQAVHLLAGAFPVNFLGVEYMGATPAYPLALWFALAGASPATQDALAYALGLAAFVSAALLARRLWPGRPAALALAGLVVPPLLLARRSLDASLSYQLMWVLGHLLLLGTFRLFARAPARGATLVALGFLAGVGLWANPLGVVYLAPLGLLALRRRLAWRRPAALGAGALVLGSAPAWLYDLAHVPSARLQVPGAGWSGPLPFGEQAALVLGRFLPAVLGAPASAPAWPGLLGAGLLGGAVLGRAIVRDRAALAWAVRGGAPPPGAPALLLWAPFVANLGLVLLTPRGAGGDRYLLPLCSIWPLWLGECLAWLWGRRRALGGAAVALVLGCYAWTDVADALGSGVPGRWRLLRPYVEPLLEWSARSGVDRVYWASAPALASYELTFLTGWRLVAADPWREPAVAHARLVDAAARPAFVLTPGVDDGDAVLAGLRDTLRGLGMAVRETAVGPFVVVEASPPPGGTVPLAPASWRIAASDDPAGARALLDRDPTTGWRTGAPQAPGQWIAVDLGRPETVARVDLLALDWQEVPAGLRVEVSADGERWTTVASVPRYWGPLFRAGPHAVLKVRRGRVQVRFPPVRARWLRLVQTGTVPHREWAARELFLYAPAPEAPAGAGGLAAALRAAGVARVHADPWIGARAGVETAGAVASDAWNLFVNDYGRPLPPPDVVHRLRLAAGQALLAGGDADVATIGAMLAARSVPRREVRLDGYAMFALLGAPPRPRRIPKDGWGAVATEASGLAWRAIDGDPATAWESGGPPRPGAGLTLDLGRPRRVGRLRLSPGPAPARVEELRVEGSLDGARWTALGPVAWAGPLYWTGWELLRDGRRGWDLGFPPALVRFLRLAPAAAWPLDRWRLAEVEVFE